MILFGKERKDYGNYEDHLLEQYKIIVETTQKISERREKANVYFLSINTALIALIGLFFPFLKGAESLWALCFALAGLVLCYFWYKLLHNYKQLNKGKFDVIHDIEKELPLKIFDYEWEILSKGEDEHIYKPLTEIEKSIPMIFGSLYSILTIVWLLVIFFGK